MRPGPTVTAIANYTGINRNSLRWIIKRDARISKANTRILSKVIAEIENGVLDFEIRGRCKVPVRRDGKGARPRVRQKYAVSLDKGRAKLSAVDRPRLPGKMPTMKELLGE